MADIPIIDVSDCRDWQSGVVGEKLVAAFSDCGFVYLINHAVSNLVLEGFLDASEQFFQLDEEVKAKSRRAEDGNQGYVKMGRETFEASRPPDLRQSYNITPHYKQQVWPDDIDAPNFKETAQKLFAECHALAFKILQSLAVGLRLSTNTFTDAHERIGKGGNVTTLRTLFYPAVGNQDLQPAEKQIRCGAHSDYGSVTLLFQDEVGGLQVMSRTGQYVDAVPLPGAVLVNIGDLMQRWTSDKLVATKHRVLIPCGGRKRQSVAFFVHPDDDFVVTDPTGKYQPISGLDYVKLKFEQTY